MDFDMMTRRGLAAALLGTLAVWPAAAQLATGDATIRNALCVGVACADDPTGSFPGPVSASLMLRSLRTRIDFVDTSTAPGSPTNDWALIANDSDGLSRFILRDMDGGKEPFGVEAGAPSSALWIEGTTGDLGIGTSLPTGDLHIVRSASPQIWLEQDSSGGSPAQTWSVFGNHSVFGVFDVNLNSTTFAIETGAPFFSMYLEDTGEFGLGTDAPEGKLHTKGDGVQLVYFESGDGGPVQVRFRTDSENRRFLATNNADQVKSQLIFGDNSIKFTGETDNGANLWMTVSAAGLVTQGPTCNPGPCDAAFDPEEFTPLPIEEHAAAMWENRFLGAVGPTSPDQPVNLTEKLGGVIHELEVAHIYIEELHATNKSQEVRIVEQAERIAAQEAAHAEQIAALLAQVEAQNARLAALEAAQAR